MDSVEETDVFAEQFSHRLKPNDILLLTGDLGAGKTTFVKGLARALGSSDLVQSPTFVYLHIYQARMPIYHFDLYRFRHSADFLAMGFEEYFSKGGLVVIEWPERIADLLPPDSLHIDLQTVSENRRTASIGLWGER